MGSLCRPGPTQTPGQVCLTVGNCNSPKPRGSIPGRTCRPRPSSRRSARVSGHPSEPAPQGLLDCLHNGLTCETYFELYVLTGSCRIKGVFAFPKVLSEPRRCSVLCLSRPSS